MEQEQIFIDNEKKANKFVSIATIIVYGILVVFSLYTLYDSNKTEYKMTCAIVFGIVGVLVATAIILAFKLPDKYFERKKYIIAIAFILVLSSYSVVFIEAVLIVPAFALGVFNRYYNNKFMHNIMIVTGVCLLVSTIICMSLGFIVDMNAIAFKPGTTITITDYSKWVFDYVKSVGITNGDIIAQWSIYILPMVVVTYIAECIVFKRINKSSNELFDKRIEIANEMYAIESDLAIATNIQTSMLATDFESFEEESNLEIYASMKAAKQVGGDFYDFFTLGDDRACIVMGDVSGKGVPAALFMVRSLACIKNLAIKGLDPAEIMTQANMILNGNNSENFYVTLWIGLYNIKTGDLQYANGGHLHPFISRAGGDFEELPCKKSFVVGMLPEIKYVVENTRLASGDRLFTYTDGVTDCSSIKKEFYGEERLHSILNSNKTNNCKDTLEAISAELEEFKGMAEQFDDITMMMVRCK